MDPRFETTTCWLAESPTATVPNSTVFGEADMSCTVVIGVEAPCPAIPPQPDNATHARATTAIPAMLRRSRQMPRRLPDAALTLKFSTSKVSLIKKAGTLGM